MGRCVYYPLFVENSNCKHITGPDHMKEFASDRLILDKFIQVAINRPISGQDLQSVKKNGSMSPCHVTSITKI